MRQTCKIFYLYISLQTYPVEWKRKAFFKFVDIFHDSQWPQELKAKVSSHIIVCMWIYDTPGLWEQYLQLVVG